VYLSSAISDNDTDPVIILLNPYNPANSHSRLTPLQLNASLMSERSYGYSDISKLRD
jgi:hypothetical protein